MYQQTQPLENDLIPFKRPIPQSQPSQLLYIEDSLTLPQWLKPLTLENNRFELNWVWTHARTLQTGLQALQTQSFDLVAVDLSLPDSQGLETFKQLQAAVPHLPILIHGTTPKELDQAHQCIQKGAIDYWRQPTQAAEVPLTQELLARTLKHIQQCQHLQQELKQSQTYRKEQQLFEQRLHSTQNQTQEVIEALNNLILILDATGDQIQIIPTGLAILDEAKTDILNQTLHLLTDSQQSQSIFTAIAHALTTQKPVEVEYRLTTHSQQLWFTANISPISNQKVIWVGQDITQRKQAEEQLQASQQFLQLVIDSIPQQIFWKDHNSVYLGCNQNFATVLGLETPSQIVGKTDDDFPWTAAKSDGSRKCDRQVMRDDQPQYHTVETQQTAEGQQIWVDTCKIPLHDQENNVVGILGTYEDITARRLTEEWLKLTQFTLDQAGDEIFLVNSQGQLFYVNDAACQSLGYTRQQLLQLTIHDIDPMLTQPVWQRHWRKLKQKQTLTRDSIHRTQQGREFPVEIRINYLKFDGQEYNCVIARDISDRIEAEEKLQQQLATIEAAIDGIALLKEGRYTYLNPAHVQLFGYDYPEELMGQSWTQLYSPTEIERFQQDVFPILAEKQAWQGEAIATCKDGRTFAEEVSLTLAPDGTLICVCRDISQRKQAEQEIVKALEMEQALNELKAGFITRMSHEFRTPLSIISSSADIMATFSHKLSTQKKQKHLEKIQTQIQQTTKLLDEILLINQAETHQLTFNPQTLNLFDFCQGVVAALQQHHHHTHTLTLNYPQGNFSMEAYADRTLLGHILTQLLSNAIKYSPDGGIISLNLAVTADQVCFQIQDQGIGIPSKAQPHLFESFYRAHNVGTIQGTGLGLSIVKKCLDLHRGKINLESIEHQGTTVTVTLPIKGKQQR